MDISWRKRRKSIFIYIFVFLVLLFSFYKLYPYLNPPPSCSDSKQNGDETGIDCGGSCNLICPNEVLPLEVKFARAVESEKGLYDLIAFVENKNKDRNVQDSKINYTFSIYDKSGSVIKTITGEAEVPVAQTFPVVVQNVPIDFGNSGNSVSKTAFSIDAPSKNWVKVNPVFGNVFFKVESANFVKKNNNMSQLSIKLKNTTKVTFRNISIKITLTSGQGNIVGINDTFLPEVKPNETKELNFTWRNPIDIDNPKIDVYPIVTPNTILK